MGKMKSNAKAQAPAAKAAGKPAPRAVPPAEQQQWLAQTVQLLTAASPTIEQPHHGAPIPPNVPLFVLISTNRIDLGYRVSLFDITPLTVPPPPVLITFIDTPPPGQQYFGVEFAGGFIQPDRHYLIRVEVIPGTPGVHNTDEIGVTTQVVVDVYRG